MKKNVLGLLFLLILVCSCGPSFSIRKQIKRNEKGHCNYPLTYKGSLKWEVFPDSIKTSFNAFDKKLNKWVDNYEPVKMIFHTYTSKNAFGVPYDNRSETIMYKDGKLEFK
jgi:hypothetical protein